MQRGGTFFARPRRTPASWDNNDPKAATRAKRRPDPAPTSVVLGGNASRQIEKGTSDEKDSHTACRRNRVVGCRTGHRYERQRLRAVSRDTKFAKRDYANLRRRETAWLQFPIRHAVERVDLSPSETRHLLQLRHRRCDSTLRPFFWCGALNTHLKIYAEGTSYEDSWNLPDRGYGTCPVHCVRANRPTQIIASCSPTLIGSPTTV